MCNLHPHFCNLYLKVLSQLLFLCVLTIAAEAQKGDPTEIKEADSKTIFSLIDQLKHADSAKRRIAADALGKLRQRTPVEVVPRLIEALNDPDAEVRRYAADALGQIGGEAKEILPHLSKALKDPHVEVRRSAANSFGRIAYRAFRRTDEGAEQAVVYLIEALKDPDAEVRRNAAISMWAFKEDVAVPQLIEVLKDPDEDVRSGVAYALGTIGAGAKNAVPQLIEALNDPNEHVRSGAADALGRIGEETKGDTKGAAKETIAGLTKALKDPSRHVRHQAAFALGRIGVGAKEAIPELIEALKDPDERVRSSTVFALRETVVDAGEETRGVITQLIEALNDPDPIVRSNAAHALDKISTRLAHQQATEFSDQIKTAADTLRDSSDPGIREKADRVQQAGDLLKLLWWEQLKQWVVNHPTISLVLAAYPSLLLIWFALLWLRPLWLLHINEALAKSTDVKLPEKLGGFYVAPRYLILIGFFHYQSKVLDAWVTKYVNSAQNTFSSLPTVREREIYVPLPVVISNEAEAHLSPDMLRPIFSRNLICVQILGEGGSGKTTLAYRLAQWAMSPQKEVGISAGHLMLPVLIEQDLVVQDTEQEPALFKAIKQQVKVMINEDDPPPAGLLRQLLKKRRVLLVIDGFSEMNEASRSATLASITDLPVNAVIITSRTDEQLNGILKTTIKPLRVRGNRLATFMEAYLTARKTRDLFEDDEFFEACRRLSMIVGDRDITALLAKLYAEQMIAVKEGLTDSDGLENIPDLMLSYLNDLIRDARPDDPDIRVVHQAAKSIAWECLKRTLRPAPAPRKDVLIALGGDEKGKTLLNYFEGTLKVIQTVGAGRDRIRFALDPLAEYLAGMYLVDSNGEDDQAWHNFLAQVDEQGKSPKDIEGFLLAIRDCCLAKGEELGNLSIVADELARLVGISSEESNQYRIERRVKQLIPRLKYSEAKDRINATEELGVIGVPAKIAVKDLGKLLNDPDKNVRRSVVDSLGRIREGTMLYLVEALKDSDPDVRRYAVDALAKIGGEVVPLLFEALKTHDGLVRTSVDIALTRVIGTGNVHCLSEALKDTDKEIRRRAANALANLAERAEEAVPNLNTALKDPDEVVRGRAAYALGKVGRAAQDAVPNLVEALKDTDKAVRSNAAYALGKIRGGAKEIMS